MSLSPRRALFALALGVAAPTLVSCATAPKTTSEKQALEQQAATTLGAMRAKDDSISYLLNNAAGYAVFPSIGKAGFVAGAAYGRGVLFEHGRQTGFVELNQGSFGAQIGAQTFSELIVLQTPESVVNMKTGNFSVGAGGSAIVLTTGAAAQADFEHGLAVFVMPRGGMMAELSISGQKVNYRPMRPGEG